MAMDRMAQEVLSGHSEMGGRQGQKVVQLPRRKGRLETQLKAQQMPQRTALQRPRLRAQQVRMRARIQAQA